MITRQVEIYRRASMKAWIACEACVYKEWSMAAPDMDIINECHNCAESCYELMYSLLQEDITALDQAAFSCMVQCNDCANFCETYEENEEMQYCATICRSCAILVKDLIVPLIPN